VTLKLNHRLRWATVAQDPPPDSLCIVDAVAG
jgi:hypothetical protein